jgi:ABC-type molybdenum transport system ATPase subunit/photorepair protein PhrA
MENVKQKTSLQERRNIEDISSILLKDTGIKSAVIREYLPVMNTLINKYLSAMDFYVKFELDETFSETIKSRHRDDFTYSSFSEGEKNRIDLALLFAWREIAKLKNSANTNLLLLDEVLDGSLDVNGTDFIINLLTQLGDICNVFVISHNIDQIVDKFDRVLTVEKRNDFSVII